MRPRLLQRFYSPRLDSQVRFVACSDYATFAIVVSGAVFQWGRIVTQTSGDVEDISVPAPVAGLQRVAALSVSPPGYYHERERLRGESYHVCALDQDGRAFMWGRNSESQQFRSMTRDAVVEPVAIDPVAAQWPADARSARLAFKPAN